MFTHESYVGIFLYIGTFFTCKKCTNMYMSTFFTRKKCTHKPKCANITFMRVHINKCGYTLCC